MGVGGSSSTMRIRTIRLALAVGAALSVFFTGCSAKPHRVTLTWGSPQSAPGNSISGYNVYRSTTSGRDFVRLATGVSGPSYEDRLVSGGRTYYYVVTAVDRAGRESSFSGEARAAIP